MKFRRNPWLLVLACSLGLTGCLRWGYSERERTRDAGSDSGADGGRSANGGRGGASGIGGASAAGTGGRGGSAGANDGGADPVDSGMNEPDERDAETDDLDAGDDAPGDAAAADGGGLDLCPERAGAIFCDGFEATNFDRWSYPVLNNGTLTRSTERKRSGDASLRATTGAAAFGNEARYATTELGSLKTGDLWMRYYYYLPGTVVVDSHFSAGVMSEIQEPYAGFSLIVRPARTDLSTMAGPVEGTLSFPRDRWVCVELHVKIDPSAGYFEAYLDDELAVRSESTNSVPAAGFRTAEVGIHYAEAAQGPVVAFVDDVVISRTRAGCD